MHEIERPAASLIPERKVVGVLASGNISAMETSVGLAINHNTDLLQILDDMKVDVQHLGRQVDVCTE